MDFPVIRVEDVHKEYVQGTVRHLALRGISFKIPTGEFIALQGSSGCGKSTLLHLLGAMDRPTAGKIWLADQRLDALSIDELALIRRRDVGFVFQAFNLLPTLNTLENVSLPLRLDGIKEKDASERAREALESVGLSARAHHQPSQLSGGEQQRAAIARALVLTPKVILADEPTGSLDSANGLRVLELLAQLNQSLAITIVMATHSHEAAKFAHRTLLIRDGLLAPQTESNTQLVGTKVHGVL